MNTPKFAHAVLAISAAMLLSAGPVSAADPVVVDVSGIPSHGLRGDLLNTVLFVHVGADALVHSLQWNVFIGSHVGDEEWPDTTYSWMDELGVAFTNSTQTAGFALRPGWQTDGPGYGVFFDGAGTLADLSPRVAQPDGPGHFQEPVANLYDINPDFRVGADGLLRLEFYEVRQKDFPAAVPDGRWISGDLAFGVTAVPEPATCAMLTLGLLAMGLLKRRSRV